LLLTISDASYNKIKAIRTNIASGELFSTSKQDIDRSYSFGYYAITVYDVLAKGSSKV